MQAAPLHATDTARRYRITTVGAYTYKKLLPTFIYLDAVVVDTPIADPAAAEEIAHSRDVEDRLARARRFLAYLDEQWQAVDRDDLPLDWPDISSQLKADFARVERSAQLQERRKSRARQPFRRRARRDSG